MITETRIPIGWGSVTALTRGPQDGKRVLLLHGWLDNAASFVPLLEHLPAEWRCVAVDMPGHGHSDHRPRGTGYHLIDAVGDVLEVADHLGWEKFTLIGHSLGAAVATLLAGCLPSHVERLVLIEGMGPFSAPAEETPARAIEHFEGMKALKHKKLPVYPDLATAIRARRLATPLSEKGAKLIVERGTKPVPGGFTWRSDPRLRLPTQRFTEEQVRAFLKHITCPTLGVVAEPGMLVKYPGWKERADLVEGMVMERLPGDHHVHLDRPDQVAALVTRFCSPAG